MATAPARGATSSGPVGGSDLAAWAAATFVVATAIGVVMRLALVGWAVPVPFDHLLHAHSHALYFGWAGLAILATATAHTTVRRSVRIAAALVAPMAVAFLASGYGPVSIAASTAVMLAWYAALVGWWRQSRGGLALEVAAFRAGFGYVGIASLGVWALAVVRSTGLGDQLAERLAIHAFLSGFGWFFLFGTVGLVSIRRLVDPAAVRRVLRWWIALAWATFPLSVVGGPEVPVLGAVARAAGVALIYPAWLWVRELWRSSEPGTLDRWGLRAAAVWFSVKTLDEAVVAIAGSPLVEALGRNGVVFHLHVALLGAVSTLVAWFLVSGTGGTTAARWLAVHHLGTASMVAGLLVAAATPLASQGAWVAALGAVVVWLAGLRWAAPVWRSRGR